MKTFVFVDRFLTLNSGMAIPSIMYNRIMYSLYSFTTNDWDVTQTLKYLWYGYLMLLNGMAASASTLLRLLVYPSTSSFFFSSPCYYSHAYAMGILTQFGFRCLWQKSPFFNKPITWNVIRINVIPLAKHLNTFTKDWMRCSVCVCACKVSKGHSRLLKRLNKTECVWGL